MALNPASMRADVGGDIALAGGGLQKCQQMLEVRVAQVAIVVRHVAPHRLAHALFKIGTAGFAGFARTFPDRSGIQARDRSRRPARPPYPCSEKSAPSIRWSATRASSFANNASRCGVEGAAISPFMILSSLSSLESRQRHIRGHHAPAQIAGQRKASVFFTVSRIQIGGKCTAARAPRKRRCESRAWRRRSRRRAAHRENGAAGCFHEQLADMRRHGTSEARTCSRMAAS